MAQNPDWCAIKAEYIAGDIGYRELAKEWRVSFRTLAQRAQREGWVSLREKHRDEIVTRTVRKMASKTASTNANKLAQLQGAADSMSAVIAGVFQDVQQFNRHIIQTREGDSWNADERIFSKVDTKAIKDLTGAMKDLTYVLRNIYDLPTILEQQAMQNATERLRLDQEKALGVMEDEGETGVVEIAPILEGAGEDG